jgi:hypothetical protein
MGHESRIELWSPNWTTFCFVGFGTDRLRRQEAMKTANRENPNRGVAWPCNRAHGAEGQNRSRSIKWAEKQEKFQPKERCFFLTSPFIELIRQVKFIGEKCKMRHRGDSWGALETTFDAGSGLLRLAYASRFERKVIPIRVTMALPNSKMLEGSGVVAGTGPSTNPLKAGFDVDT